jgi:lipoprotein-anchoring transpeptidase ErfK/SrfK
MSLRILRKGILANLAKWLAAFSGMIIWIVLVGWVINLSAQASSEITTSWGDDSRSTVLSVAPPQPITAPEIVDSITALPTPAPEGPKLARLIPMVNPTMVPIGPTIAVGEERVNVRSGPGTDYARVGSLEPGAQAPVTGRHGDWWQIESDGAQAWVAGWVVTAHNTSDVPEIELPEKPPASTALSPIPVPPPATPAEVNEARWIDVNLGQQMLTAYEGQTAVRTTLISAGLPSTPTPTGQFRIWVKFRYDDMEGPGYFLADVPYVMYFHKGYGLHGVYWHANFGNPMSHGCVNLPTNEAEWLFNWADVGTLVNVH